MDLDSDGTKDLISGSWPGELYFFRGKSAGDFEAPVMLKDKDGEIINVEGGVLEQPGGGILITGHTEWKTDEESGKHFVIHRGKRYESSLEKPVSSTGCAAHLHVADWDNDGDPDLLVGTIGGYIYLVPNEGSAGKNAFGKARKLRTGKTNIKVQGDASPFCVDWDGDGDLDLLSGGDPGSVMLFENTGTREKPDLRPGRQLISPGKMLWGDEAPEEVVRGGRSKLCVTDWNEDGRLDLLVGDISYQKQLPLDLSPEEARKIDEAKEKLGKLRHEWGEVVQKLHGPNRVKTEEEQKAALEKMSKLQEKMDPLQEMVPEETVYHGSVWLFLRK